jgi:flagellar biosynthesis protein FlhG
MSDQADGLRLLARVRPGRDGPEDPADAPARTRSLVFTSGKGGVGTSNLALNLAIALGEYGQRVVLVDADLGLANLDLLCGMSPSWDLGDVLAGRCLLAEAIVTGPGAIRIVSGAHGMRTLAECLAEGPTMLANELAGLERTADFLLVDAGSGLNPGIVTLASAADQVVVVTTPEPTSMADAHAALGRFRRMSGGPSLRAIVNQAACTADARESLIRLCASSREFHGLAVAPLGFVRYDPKVKRAVRQRRPFLVDSPRGVAARCVRRLARTLIEERGSKPRRGGFFAALMPRWSLARVPR